jgi:hypothetical protein
MAKQYVLTRITKDNRGFLVGNPCCSASLAQLGRKNAQASFPGQKIVLRDYEAFKKLPVRNVDKF